MLQWEGHFIQACGTGRLKKIIVRTGYHLQTEYSVATKLYTKKPHNHGKVLLPSG